ncbi:MAG: endonuclease/exonuclease/phosphatase family protein [Candidatus Marinimicrobia bacterium]|nr:endonuclease/exonuclease/phosphatase family protein [Candidatus Neomarinimicrobiota bacterium]
MKTHLIPSLFLALTLTVSMAVAQDTLKILSYNIEGMKPGTDYPARLQAIIQELKILDPDIMGLQEVAQHSSSDNMAQTIADSLSIYFGSDYYVYWQMTHTAYSSYSEGIGTVSKWPITASGYQSLPVAVFPRKVLWNQLNIQGVPLHFFTTHLAYRDEDNATRVQQINSIRSFINSKTASVPGPAILTGDFNCTPASDPIALLSEYSSSWNLLHPTLSGYTYPSNNPIKKIDYVFVKNDYQPVILQSSLKFFVTYDGTNYPSDHWGLMTTAVVQTTNLDQPENLPDQLQLLTYPNPFNGNLTMRVILREPSDLTLEIFNLHGKREYYQDMTNLSTGEHRFTWQPRIEDSSGVYLCRIRTKNETLIRKLMLVK